MPETADSLSFPDAPRNALDKALSEVVERATEVLATQGRLRALLTANQAVIERLELPIVLRRIVEAAVELVGAQYGALGVTDAHGGLEQFIHVGMPSSLVEEIGHLPEGHGLLGALIDDPRAIRLEHLGHDARSAGFPAHHPPMDSFLGVPVRVHGEVYGNLYLTNQASGTFSEDDEQLITSLASTAGFAIENARLYAETQRRQSWSAASAAITAALLSADDEDPLTLVADRILELADAAHVFMVFPTSDGLRTGVAVGAHADAFIDQLIEPTGSIASGVMEGQQPRLLTGDEVEAADILLTIGERPGPIMAIPILGTELLQGVLITVRTVGAPLFTEADLEMVADFAGQTSVAMELASARADKERVMLFEDRGRIARDLHDHVIQQLFGTGLELQAAAGAIGPGATKDRISSSIDALDAAIAQIRTVIYALSSERGNTPSAIRDRLIDLAAESGGGLPRSPQLMFAGAVDLAIRDGLADDVVAVVRETLTNAAKHSGAENVSVSLSATEGRVVVEIVDDGLGMPKTHRRSGLANLETRARARGGEFTITSDRRGTRVIWDVPYDAEAKEE